MVPHDRFTDCLLGFRLPQTQHRLPEGRGEGLEAASECIIGTRFVGLICFPHWVADAQILHRKPRAQCSLSSAEAKGGG